MQVRHTSEQEIGQVYVPRSTASCSSRSSATVLGFRSSDNLGAAYGIAVTGTMTIDDGAGLYLHAQRSAMAALAAAAAVRLVPDRRPAFFGANLLKIVEGGWFPLAIGAFVFTHDDGVVLGPAKARRASAPAPACRSRCCHRACKPDRPARVPGTAIFMTAQVDDVPAALLHNLKHNKVLHERIVLMTVQTEDVPHVPRPSRLEIRHLDQNFHTMRIRYGFMDEPNIPRALAQCRVGGFRFNLMETSFFVGREKIVPAAASRWSSGVKRLFICCRTLTLDATEFFRIPANRVVELGGQIEI